MRCSHTEQMLGWFPGAWVRCLETGHRPRPGGGSRTSLALVEAYAGTRLCSACQKQPVSQASSGAGSLLSSRVAPLGPDVCTAPSSCVPGLLLLSDGPTPASRGAACLIVIIFIIFFIIFTVCSLLCLSGLAGCCDPVLVLCDLCQQGGI